MKTSLHLVNLTMITLVVILFQIGCEKHSAEETVPGYTEKKAQQEKLQRDQASHPLEREQTSPQFFPTPSKH